MLKLNISSEPFWLDFPHGVRLLLLPLTSAMMMAARGDAALADIAEDAPVGVRTLAFCKAVARLAIKEWDGVGDADGKPIAVSPEGINALLDIYPIFEAFELDYIAAHGLALDAEKNG